MHLNCLMGLTLMFMSCCGLSCYCCYKEPDEPDYVGRRLAVGQQVSSQQALQRRHGEDWRTLVHTEQRDPQVSVQPLNQRSVYVSGGGVPQLNELGVLSVAAGGNASASRSRDLEGEKVWRLTQDPTPWGGKPSYSWRKVAVSGPTVSVGLEDYQQPLDSQQSGGEVTSSGTRDYQAPIEGPNVVTKVVVVKPLSGRNYDYA